MWGQAPEFENWLLGQRARLRDRAVICLQQIASGLAEKGEEAAAISHAQRLLELEPWREESHRLLMSLYARSGQLTSALSQYETCRQILDAELGIEPNRETEALFQKIRESHKVTRTIPLSNVPIPTTGFVGRDDELTELMTYLRNPEVRLLTIVGMGGAGKTRLALAMIAELVDSDFPDGRFFTTFESLQFSDIDDELAVQSTIAAHVLISMEIPIAPKEAPLQQLIAHLRMHHYLLIFDNVETLLLPEVAPAVVTMIQTIISQAPQLKLLLTSRQPLHLRAEWIFDIGGLPLPVDEIVQTASVQLFYETAHRLNRHFDLEAERTAVNEICHLLDGLPLGIELAASLVRQKRCTEIADQIEQSLEGVAAKWQDLPPRHRSLKATFEYTWKLLTKQEQQLLAMLAYMRRGFSNDAAQSVVGERIQLLDHLVDKSLVKRQDARYFLHEVVLQFARQKLADVQPWRENVALQHAHYFLEQAKLIERGLETGDDYPMCQRLRPDLENIRLAWRWAIKHGETEWLNHAARGLMVFFHSMGWLTEGMVLMQEAVTSIQSQPSKPLTTLINCLLQQALLMALATDLVKATELADASAYYLKIYAEEDNKPAQPYFQAYQHFLYGYIAHGNSDWAMARAELSSAANAFHNLNRTYDEARAYFVIGNGWMGERNWQKVIEVSERVVSLCQKSGNQRMEAKTLATMASAYNSDNKLEDAKRCRERANLLWAQIEWPIRDEVVWFGMAAEQALDAGYLDEAASHLRQAMPLVAQSGSMFYEDWHHILQGHLFLQLGNHEQAIAHYKKAKDSAVAVEKPGMIAFVLICLCLAYYHRGKSESVKLSAQQLVDVSDQIDGAYYRARADNWLGLAMMMANQAQEAHAHFLQALDTTTDEICFIEAQWGMLLCYQQQKNQAAAFETAVTLLTNPLFDNLPKMLTEILLPFQIYFDCWQALAPVDPTRAENVLKIAADHLSERFDRIEKHAWKQAFLQQATCGGRFPLMLSE